MNPAVTRNAPDIGSPGGKSPFQQPMIGNLVDDKTLDHRLIREMSTDIGRIIA